MDIATVEKTNMILDDVKAKRNHLVDRVERARDIASEFFITKKNIRVRSVKGNRVYLINGAGGAVYRVSGSKFSCTCPDHMQRGITCKHGIAIYAIDRSLFGSVKVASKGAAA